MKSFLETVAEDILQKYGTNLSRTAVVFPNKRASLFLNEALAHLADRPLWSPAYITISELFRRHSSLQVADPLKQVCDLHKCYTEITGFDETLDHFFGWGQLLLTDFDDIDKSMVSTDQLFANLAGIHEFDDVSYLNEQQREAIRKFFSHFTDDHNTLLKERFLRLWAKMGDIYTRLNQQLREQGLAYEGALYRQVATDEHITFEYDRYLFVGFNLLQQVEHTLFRRLQREGKAHFYWDYDHYYLSSEAGHFIAQYLDKYPNELPSDLNDVYDCFRLPKDITFMASPTENAQARFVSTWLSQDNRIADGRRTAIVLCDENLLVPVVHCLPEQVTNVNITTGYPLQQTPVSALIHELITLQTFGYDRQRNRFRQKQLNNVLRNPYMRWLSEQLVATPCDDNSQLLHWLTGIVRRIAQGAASPSPSPNTQHPDPFTTETLFRTYTLLNRLASLVDSGQLSVDVITLQRLIAQLIQQTTIPFHGEPVEGIQVMGVLETRNLDFDHLLLLSTNEGKMPRGISDASFIPYTLRKAFGLTTTDHKVAIFAYHFHRLLSRATDVTLAYNNATNDGQTGEMSRFMLQLLVESGHTIRQQAIASLSSAPARPKAGLAIAKTPAIIEALRRRFAADPSILQSFIPSILPPLLTPTAINRYQRCPLQFYYCYVEGLREPDTTDDDTIDNRLFGNIFHEAARLLYQRLTPAPADSNPKQSPPTRSLSLTNHQSSHPTIHATDIDKLLNDVAGIERCVDQALRQELFKLNDSNARLPELNGLQLINREVMVHYLRQLLRLDRQLTPFSILQLEADVVEPIDIPAIGITTTIGGRIDRLDCIHRSDGNGGESRIRVIDYKTGANRPQPLRNVEAVFDPSQLRNHTDYYLQTLLYARIVSRQHQATIPVAPALLFIQHTAPHPSPNTQPPSPNTDPILRFGQSPILDVATPDGDHFDELLRQTIDRIFSPAIPFTPTDNPDVCRTCPYAAICGLNTTTS